MFGLSLRDRFDPLSQNWIDNVEAADGQFLEAEVKVAISRFVKGCRVDNNLNAIKSCCILAGARTLAGALVPLVGNAPTNVGFVAADYNRKTGLKGNATNKFLNSNRANNADPQDSKHIAVWMTNAGAAGASFSPIGSGTGAVTGDSMLFVNNTTRFYRANYSNVDGIADVSRVAGFWGVNRGQSSSVVGRYANTNYAIGQTSATPTASNILVFCRGTTSFPVNFTDGRILLYSIGESINLEKLDSRIAMLSSALNTFISS